MRFSTSLLPLLVASTATAQQQQAPLVDQVRGWWAAATAKASSLAAAAPASLKNPAAAGAAALASTQVTRLTVANRNTVVDEKEATWLVFVTGGNKTCYGRCLRAEEAWNRSVPALSVARNHVRPKLGLIDCETDPVLCGTWVVSPPSIFELKPYVVTHTAADQSVPPAAGTTVFRYLKLNATSVSAEALTALYTEGAFDKVVPYEGVWHPVDGLFAKTSANVGWGYLTWALGLIPSWIMMVGISMFSRTFLSKRLGTQPGQQRPQAATPARPAAPAAVR